MIRHPLEPSGQALAAQTVNALRTLAAARVEAAGSGHPRTPLGAAPMADVLCTKFLRHKLRNPAGGAATVHPLAGARFGAPLRTSARYRLRALCRLAARPRPPPTWRARWDIFALRHPQAGAGTGRQARVGGGGASCTFAPSRTWRSSPTSSPPLSPSRSPPQRTSGA